VKYRCRCRGGALVPPTFGLMQKDKTTETLALAEQILQNIELGDIPLSNACLKAARLARLLNDVRHLGKLTKLSSDTITLESQIEASKIRLAANPGQHDFGWERDRAASAIINTERELQKSKIFVYNYVLNAYYELRFSSVPAEVFKRARDRVDKKLAEMVPETVKKFVSVYDNLKSNNPEDWSNAVHSCRRVLQAVADVLYPPNPDGMIEIERNGRKIKVGPDNYINRLILYAEDHSNSKRFKGIVGSHLRFLGDRIDAIHSAAAKGSHADIQTLEEAERYVIYTYLLLGDLLSLQSNKDAEAS